MSIVALAALTLAILIGIFIYDHTRKDRVKKMLTALRKLHGGSSITTTKSISKSSLISAYPCSSNVFNTTLHRIKTEEYIVEDKGKLKFTPWGKKFYETKIRLF